MKIGVLVFPGSNCDHDAYYSIKHVIGVNTEFLFHKEHDLKGVDAVIVPGGFSYGDYLRCGAIARFSPIMEEVVKFANSGGPVMGICNGFQILCEAGLLPGGLLRNTNTKFISKYVNLLVSNNKTIFTSKLVQNQILSIPIAHGEGNYYADENLVKTLQDNNQIVFQYCDINGNLTEESNPNGSVHNIAGIVNKNGNVLGMMPHPERACDLMLGSTDGIAIFSSLIDSLIVSI
ncbi:MAG: phosphoribosylformylglycinamidine synthase subunit PurQ [Chlorobiota bacterium]|nr:phosphoribosylformylglycinamidine synthase subunit PurQ [Chlorobiota bacterium]QQS66953.1 MAG: phosphoribosylformylglycinamidine synthase subunit PurQ [Chlorobiota bacterium]